MSSVTSQTACIERVSSLHEADSVFNVLGSGRNNESERIKSKEASILVSPDGNSAKFSDGSPNDEIRLNVKDSASGRFVAVFEGGDTTPKILGVVKVPDEGDAVFGYFNGTLKFIKELAIPKIIEGIAGGSSGRLAIIGCGENGKSSIEFLAGNGNIRNIKIDGDGFIIAVDETTTTDENVPYKDDYREIYNFSGGTGTYTDNAVVSLGAENAGKFAFVSGDLISGNSGTSGISQLSLSCNGRRVVKLAFDNGFDNVCDDENSMIVPIDSSGNLNIALSVSNIGDVYAKMFLVGIFKNIS